MKKMKVAFFADTLKENIDGAVRTMYQIINRIPKDEFEFLFIVGEKPEAELPFKCIEVPTLTIPFNPDYKIAINTFTQSRLEKSLEGFAPDIIHIASPSILGRFAVNYAEKHSIPAVTIYHTHFISYIDYYFRKLPFIIEPSRKFVISHMQNFYNRCHAIYVPSNMIINELADLGILRSKMKLWQRGLDNTVFNAKKKQANYWDDTIPKNKFKLLFASRLVWEKNLSTLIDIYDQSKRLDLPYQFIIAGDGYARAELQQSMPEAIFMGELSQDKLSEVYANSDVFVFPSVSETYGNVVVEAMATGLACVIAEGCGTADFIKHNHSGLVCPAFDALAYIEAIEELRYNIQLRKRLTYNAELYARGMSWDTLVDSYFKDLLQFKNKKLSKSA